MKKLTLVLILMTISASMAQQLPHAVISQKKATNRLLRPKKEKFSLNFGSLQTNRFEQTIDSLPESMEQKFPKQPTPLDNMLIYESDGTFFVEIYDIEPTVDFKLQIYGLKGI